MRTAVETTYPTKNGRHLGFYRKLEIVKKRLKLKIFDAGHVEYDIIEHFPAFC